MQNDSGRKLPPHLGPAKDNSPVSWVLGVGEVERVGFPWVVVFGGYDDELHPPEVPCRERRKGREGNVSRVKVRLARGGGGGRQ